jgi:hypothetical protein
LAERDAYIEHVKVEHRCESHGTAFQLARQFRPELFG